MGSWIYVVKVHVKVSFFLIKHQSCECYGGNGNKASFFLNLDGRCRWVVRFTPRHSRGMKPRYQLYRNLNWPHSLSGHCGTETSRLPLTGSESDMKYKPHLRFGVEKTVKTENTVFRKIALFNLVEDCRCFAWVCCLHLRALDWKVKVVCLSETFLALCLTIRCQAPEDISLNKNTWFYSSFYRCNFVNRWFCLLWNYAKMGMYNYLLSCFQTL
jgi:hypothetical protein